MNLINKWPVSRKTYECMRSYYQGMYDRACAISVNLRNENAAIIAENVDYKNKLDKIIACSKLLKEALNEYDDICEAISKITDVDFKLTEFSYKLGRILDADEMF